LLICKTMWAEKINLLTSLFIHFFLPYYRYEVKTMWLIFIRNPLDTMHSFLSNEFFPYTIIVVQIFYHLYIYQLLAKWPNYMTITLYNFRKVKGKLVRQVYLFVCENKIHSIPSNPMHTPRCWLKPFRSFL